MRNYGGFSGYAGDGGANQLYLKPTWRIASGRSSSETDTYTNDPLVAEVRLDGSHKIDRYTIDGLLLSGDQIASIEFIKAQGRVGC